MLGKHCQCQRALQHHRAPETYTTQSTERKFAQPRIWDLFRLVVAVVLVTCKVIASPFGTRVEEDCEIAEPLTVHACEPLPANFRRASLKGI